MLFLPLKFYIVIYRLFVRAVFNALREERSCYLLSRLIGMKLIKQNINKFYPWNSLKIEPTWFIFFFSRILFTVFPIFIQKS